LNFQTTANSLKSTAYFPALTGVRALAAYLVFLQHNRPDIKITENFARTYLNTGHTGVTMFFVLSGFLISYRYADDFSNGNVDFAAYFRKRFARIMPLYLFLTVFLLLWLRDFQLWHWFLNLTLLKGYFDNEKFTAIFQAWSLTVEETFYFLAPLVFILLRKSGWLAFTVLMGTGILIVMIAKAFGSNSFMLDFEFMLSYSFFGRCFEFICGYWLARYIKNQLPDLIIKPTWPKFTALGALLLVTVYLAINFSGKYGWVLFEMPAEVWLNNFILPLPITLFYFGLLTESSLFAKLFSTRAVQFLGRSSYAFYLVHAGLFYEFMYFHLSKDKVIIFLALNVVAIALYKLVEEPANKFLNNRLSRSRKTVAV